MRFLPALALGLVVVCPPARTEAIPVRGALPWHNFLSGPTAWNESDWRDYLDSLQKLGINHLTLHNYTGGAGRYLNYVEPMVRVAYRGVLPDAAFDTSLTARWGYRPLPVSRFAFDTGRLFGGRTAYGSDAALEARTNEERYERAQTLIRRVFEMARERGIRTGMGFEFGIYPPELFSIVPDGSYLRATMLPDPTHFSSKEILHGTIDDILRAYPGIDTIWLWLQEHEAPALGGEKFSPEFQKLLDAEAALFAGGPGMKYTGVWSLAYIREAHAYLKQRAPKVRLVISGWGGGNQLTALLGGLHRGLPRDVVLSCLNPDQGESAHPAVFAEIAKEREVWTIPWLEGDAKLWHPQPRVGLMREQVLKAKADGVQGVFAIHWRTEDVADNFAAFARFARDPDNAPTVEQFYKERRGALASLYQQMESERWFNRLESPEYYPYDPTWGRLKPELRTKIEAAAQQDPELRFVLLLDQVGRAMEPAYNLRHLGRGDLAEARRLFAEAPVEELFRTCAGMVHSRGRLGVLSSLNQRLWTEYSELRDWLAKAH